MSKNFLPLLEIFFKFLSVSYRRDVRLIWGTVVVGHEGVELQGVELEAGVVDVLHVLHGVLVHGQQGGGLEGRESILQVLAPCQSLYYAATKACDEVFFHVSSAITLPVRVRQ